MKFQGLRDVGDPVELGAAYSDRGADELVFLDVKATLEERDTLVGVVRRVAEQLAIPFTVGGGIRGVADADALLSAGRRQGRRSTRPRSRAPSLITELAEKLGSQAVVVAIDTEAGRVRTRAGTTETPRGTVEWAREAQERGAGEILLTSIDADGTREGYDLEITRRGRGRGHDPGDRLGRRGRRAPRGRGARGRAGGAARVDPARGPRPAHVAARGAARDGGGDP